MVHPSKRDWWLVALVVPASVLMICVGIYVPLIQWGKGAGQVLPPLLLGPVGCFVLWALFTTSYEITSTDLVIRCGPFRGKIPLDAIMEAFPSHNPLSAPAWSLDRLRINFRRKNGKMAFALISPVDKAGFLRELAQNSRGLQVSGDRAVRVPTG